MAAVTVLVTGASSGIGRAVASEFAARGHTVFAAARRLDSLAELAETRTGIYPIPVDVTDRESVRAAWASVDEQTGGKGVDILVNNAGFALSGPVELLDPADLRRQFDTNVFGLVAMTQVVLPAMRARGAGRIVNISSVLGRMTFPGMGAYSATKYAVESLSDALRVEVAGFGIDVVVIEPGFVATNLAHAVDARRASPPDTENPYLALGRRGDAYLAQQMAEAPSPGQAAVGIVDEALRSRARPRRLLSARDRATLALLTNLPDRIADAAKRRVLKLD
jgi:NADP-dependent 3-hydroxy acid dehydrogenase YdfG